MSYFWRMYMRIGEPRKLNSSRSLFSKYRLYGSLINCGELLKNMKVGQAWFGNCVTYLI